MIDLKKMFLATALTAGLTPLLAQEPWDSHLKLTGGLMNGAEENYIGQNKVYGVALAGSYPLTIKGSGVLECGYKVFPTTSTSYGLTVVDDKTDIYFAGAMYRHELWRNGIYLQGGIMATNTKTLRDMIYKGAGENGGDVKEKRKGERETGAGWYFGAGYRLTELWTLEISASSVGFKNVDGVTSTGTIFEIALCIHR